MSILSNDAALVTGAGSGIGRAIAERLAAEGARVALVGRRPSALDEVARNITARGGHALAVRADVTDRCAVEGAVEQVRRRFGCVSLLVNAAGVIRPFGPIGTVDPREWWATQEVHVLGPVLCMHAVLPGMRERRAGRIINVVSLAGLRPTPYLSAYSVGKSTAIRVTTIVDIEERRHGIRAFALQPGIVLTDMAREVMRSADAERWLPKMVDMLRSRSVEESAGDLRRCLDTVAALSSGDHDELGGRYLDATLDLDAQEDRSDG